MSVRDEPVDVSGEVAGEDMPCCPLCDNAVAEDDAWEIVVSDGALALCHLFCAAGYAERLRDKGGE